MRVLLIAYDNDSYIHYFPLGLAYVASKMRQEGHHVEVYPQDIYHYPEAHLTQFLDEREFDMVGIGMCAGYYQYAKLLKLCEAIHNARNRPYILLGGHLVSPDPEYFKFKTNASKVCVGEYDYTTDLDSLPYPAWDLFNIDYYSLIRLPHAENSDRCFPVLSGRGCPFTCTFCYRLTPGYRPRSIEGIVDEIKELQRRYRINYIDFADELLMVSSLRTIAISEALEPLKIKWMCNGRLNQAKSETLKAMKKAGCVFISYGIESVDDNVLKLMNKQLTYEQIEAGIQYTLEAGISPRLNILWGNLGDRVATLEKSVKFLLKYDDHEELRTIRPVTPYPGCPLYYKAIEEGKLKDIADFYENKHINSDLLAVNFTGLTDEQFHYELYLANMELIEHYYLEKSALVGAQCEDLYMNRNASFRGFRQT